jgi:hypothetical protein
MTEVNMNNNYQFETESWRPYAAVWREAIRGVLFWKISVKFAKFQCPWTFGFGLVICIGSVMRFTSKHVCKTSRG